MGYALNLKFILPYICTFRNDYFLSHKNEYTFYH